MLVLPIVLARVLALALVISLLAVSPTAPGATGTPARGSEAPHHVLVFGGTGHLGAEIVERLVARGDRVTVFTRPGSDRSALAGMSVELVAGDLLNGADVAAAFTGRSVDVVVVAVRVETGDIHFYEKILTQLVAEAKAAGVERLVHNGAVGAGQNAARFGNLGWEKVPGLLDRLRDQGVGEDLIRAGGVPWVIIRNTRLYPAGTPATGRAVLTEEDSVISPMTRADLAAFNVRCVSDPACLGKTWHIRDDSLAWPPPD